MNHENAQQANVPEATAHVADENEKQPTTLVDTLFDIGLAWAEFGVGQGKLALETSAKTLEKSLHDLQQRLRKDHDPAS
jgi:hypothetical protein